MLHSSIRWTEIRQHCSNKAFVAIAALGFFILTTSSKLGDKTHGTGLTRNAQHCSLDRNKATLHKQNPQRLSPPGFIFYMKPQVNLGFIQKNKPPTDVEGFVWVEDRSRTGDLRNHNPAL